MSNPHRYSAAEKLAILDDLEKGQSTLWGIANKYDIHKKTLLGWRHRYELYGYSGLEIRTHNQNYSTDLKIRAVQDYLSGNGSHSQIIDKYRIASDKQLREWIKKYNSHSRFKSCEGGRISAMTKGRSTTWQERIDIVLNCLSRNYNYQITSQDFRISYQQVYQWVKGFGERSSVKSIICTNTKPMNPSRKISITTFIFTIMNDCRQN